VAEVASALNSKRNAEAATKAAAAAAAVAKVKENNIRAKAWKVEAEAARRKAAEVMSSTEKANALQAAMQAASDSERAQKAAANRDKERAARVKEAEAARLVQKAAEAEKAAAAAKQAVETEAAETKLKAAKQAKDSARVVSRVLKVRDPFFADVSSLPLSRHGWRSTRNVIAAHDCTSKHTSRVARNTYRLLHLSQCASRLVRPRTYHRPPWARCGRVLG
jgi:hypothetical protein